MDISNINGSNAYIENKSATPPVDNARLENQNRETTKTDPAQKANPAQQAFEVNITREARDLLAAEETPPAVQAGADQKSGSDQNPVPAQDQTATQETRQIVNIIA